MLRQSFTEDEAARGPPCRRAATAADSAVEIGHLTTIENRRQTMARDVTVTPQNPLYVTDSDRTFGTVTIKPGGQVFIQTAADVKIDKLVKSN